MFGFLKYLIAAPDTPWYLLICLKVWPLKMSLIKISSGVIIESYGNII
jgi:hypothetical protein